MNLQTYESILTGFKNFIFKSPTQEEMAKERAKICSSCPNANPMYPFKLFKPGEPIKEIKGLGCDKCGCLISAKVRSPLERCPEDKW